MWGLVEGSDNIEQVENRRSVDKEAGQPAGRLGVSWQDLAHSTGKQHEGSRGMRGQPASEPHRQDRTAGGSEPCSSGTARSWRA